MACWMCVYGKAKIKTSYGSDNWGPFNDAPGFCTKNPKWEEVTAKHYCHELKMESPYLPGYWRDCMREDQETISKLREENKKLRERKKYLNEKIRKLS